MSNNHIFTPEHLRGLESLFLADHLDSDTHKVKPIITIHRHKDGSFSFECDCIGVGVEIHIIDGDTSYKAIVG